jgi:hypothetical protein
MAREVMQSYAPGATIIPSFIALRKAAGLLIVISLHPCFRSQIDRIGGLATSDAVGGNARHAIS